MKLQYWPQDVDLDLTQTNSITDQQMILSCGVNVLWCVCVYTYDDFLLNDSIEHTQLKINTRKSSCLTLDVVADVNLCLLLRNLEGQGHSPKTQSDMIDSCERKRA